MQCLIELELSDKVVGMGFYNTSSITGSVLGACTLLQQKLWRLLFHFTCHHHFMKLVAEAAFTRWFGPSTGLDIFNYFQSNWNSIDRSKYEPIKHNDLDSVVDDGFLGCKEKVVSFYIQKLECVQPCDDYRKLLEYPSFFWCLSSKGNQVNPARCPSLGLMIALQWTLSVRS